MIQKCAPHERSLCAPNLELKGSDKTTLYTLMEAKVMSAPSSTKPEERVFVVDSGASMHMMSKKEYSPEEMDTVKRFRTPTVVLTAKGEVFVHYMSLFVTVQLLEETPAVLSLGKLCEDHGCS